MYLEITLLSYLIDKFFGEFNFIRHPIIMIGDYIKWYEKKFYKNTILSGFLLTISIIVIVFIICYILETILPWWIIAIIGSISIASKMLYHAILDIISNPSNIRYLVSRDTKNLTQSDINKAAIESYAENLSDGVVAPIFYLLIFGLYGAFVYKTINTLDSMVGYKNKKYINFGKVSAKLDDIVNYIPSRITAFLISFLTVNKEAIKNIFRYGHLHDSPNAGYPISAMAGFCNVRLGGNTSYFGKMVTKPYFGNGNKLITKNHIKKALSFQVKFDIFIITILGVFIVISRLV